MFEKVISVPLIDTALSVLSIPGVEIINHTTIDRHYYNDPETDRMVCVDGCSLTRVRGRLDGRVFVTLFYLSDEEARLWHTFDWRRRDSMERNVRRMVIEQVDNLSNLE